MKNAIDTSRFDANVVHQLGRIDLIAHLICDGLAHGVHSSRRKGFSTEFSDFRPYVPGDDPRLLDWRVFARTERLFVKQFEAETSIEMMLVLDATASMAWRWKDTITKLEYAANLLAALAAIHIRQNDQVGMLVHDADDIHYLPPRARTQQLDAIFATLAGIHPGKADTFPALIESIVDHRRHRGRIVLCSDLEEDEEGVLKALDRLSGLQDEVVLFHILDAAEEEIPFSDGTTHIEDSETGELLPINVNRLRQDHEVHVREFRDFWHQHCVKWGAVYVPVNTKMNYAEVIMSFSEARMAAK